MLFGGCDQHADLGRRHIQRVSRRTLRDDLIGCRLGHSGDRHGSQLKPATADVDLRRPLAITRQVGNGDTLRTHTFGDPHVPTAPYHFARRRDLRDDPAFRYLGAVKAVGTIQHQSVGFERGFRFVRTHPDDFGDRGLAPVNGQAHSGKRRRHEDDNQDKYAYQPAEEAPHQWVSPSPGVWSGVSTLWATAFGAGGGGAVKLSDSRPCSATRMKSIQMGSAATAPVSLLPRVFFSSKPIHTPHVIDGEKPTNQASVKSLVVPVLPPSG